MKKVRFESPVKRILPAMHESECHFPRPFIHKQVNTTPHVKYLDYRTVPYTNDPVQRFECGNSSPYPIVTRTSLTDTAKLEQRWAPSNELDLSMLDSALSARIAPPTLQTDQTSNAQPVYSNIKMDTLSQTTTVLSPMENKSMSGTPNILRKNDDFFLRRDNLNAYKTLSTNINNLQLDKENNPLLKKSQIMMMGQSNLPLKNVVSQDSSNSANETDDSPCRCHHCVKVCKPQHVEQPRLEMVKKLNVNKNGCNMCHCIAMIPQNYPHCACKIPQIAPKCNCNIRSTTSPQNAVDKKTWALKRYEQNKTECLDVEKQANITMDNKDPTVADLFKIIKMQNEQLQLLQEKVDKFISSNTSNGHKINPPVEKYLTEQVALEAGNTEKKISIGVMTSFEVVRTSTIINKEFIKQNEAQIQCNRSQISIKEVVSTQPANLNFLDGLAPVTNQVDSEQPNKNNPSFGNGEMTKNDYVDDKTLNEISLYNVQVDNAITPNISPEQSLYLDIRDYSDSDASSDDNVGWTYYNKVMTHVNGMLQESDMPSSASALYRNVKQKCIQMQIDKANVSVAKRVTFGDDPLGLQKPQVQQALCPSTDTSLKMKQLAAKYLTNGASTSNSPSPRPGAMPVDMSLATRNYMEKHQLLRATNMQSDHPNMDIPKFLDITALKRQPKLL